MKTINNKKIMALSLTLAFLAMSSCKGGQNTSNSGSNLSATLETSSGFISTSESSEDPLDAFDKEIITIYPGNGQTISILKEEVSNYIDAMHNENKKDDYYFDFSAFSTVQVTNFLEEENLQKSKSIHLIWDLKDGIESSSYRVKLGLKEDLSDAKVIETNETYIELDNLLSSSQYFWKVEATDSNYESIISTFYTKEGTRMINAGDVVNIRDIGGYMTESGKRVKQGLAFRGSEVVLSGYYHNDDYHYQNLNAESIKILHDDLKIRTELDFRGLEESNNKTASDLGSDVNYIRKSIGAYTSLLGMNSDGSINLTMRNLYKEVFLVLADASSSPVYFHCWGGADRTGTIAFLLNGLLGVSFTDLVIDYELTSFTHNICTRDDVPETYRYFTSMVNELKAAYSYNGDETISQCIENYMRDCLGLTNGNITQLKNTFLEGDVL